MSQEKSVNDLAAEMVRLWDEKEKTKKVANEASNAATDASSDANHAETAWRNAKNALDKAMGFST